MRIVEHRPAARTAPRVEPVERPSAPSPVAASSRSPRYAAKLLGLLEYSTRASGPEALDDTLSVLLLSLMGEFQAPGGVVLMRDPADGTLKPRVAKGVLGRPDRVPSVLADDDPAPLASALGLATVVPITHHTGTLGALGLARRLSGEPLGGEDAELVRLVAGVAGSAIASYRLYEELRAVNRTVERQLFDLHTLFDISRDLSLSVEPVDVFRVVAQTVMAHVLVSRCIILLEDRGRVRVEVVRGLHLAPDVAEAIAELRFGDAVRAIEDDRGSPLLARLEPAGIRHLIPLGAGGEPRGILGIGAKTDGRSLAQQEIEFLSMLGSQAFAALDNLRFHADRARRARIEHDLAIARDIQQALLPTALPSVPGYDLAAVSEPCFEVGGDYFDALHVPQGLLFAVGDVSGKSVPAALLMSVVQATVRSLAGRPGESPASLVEALNRHLARSTQPAKFVTFFIAVLDPADGTIAYTNAGHNPPLLVHREGPTERLREGGPVLGVFDETEYGLGRATLAPGDLLFVFTDGVTEAVDRNEAEFGEERLEALLRQVRGRGAEAAVSRTVTAVRAHASGQVVNDDLTVLALERRAVE